MNPVTRGALIGFGFAVGTAGGIALAVFAVPHPDFEPGTSISSRELEDNFKSLSDGMDGLQVELDGLKAAAARTPSQCGSTGGTLGRVTNGLGAVGYPAIKSLCEQACGSPTAHGCRADEIVRMVERGSERFSGWYISGVWVGGVQMTAGTGVANDCEGWTSTDPTLAGAYWGGPAELKTGMPGAVDCNDPGQGGRRFLCCD